MLSHRTKVRAASLHWPAVLAFLVLTLALLSWVAVAGGGEKSTAARGTDQKEQAMSDTDKTSASEKIIKTDEEWKLQLTPEQYRIARKGGTERAFTGKYNDHKEDGVYTCVSCGQPLFDSDTKYNSGSGWPSFFKPFDSTKVAKHEDRSLGMMRVEVKCSRCDAHLGHVFDDGPQPTGLRYCVNSAALDFKAENNSKESNDPEQEDDN